MSGMLTPARHGHSRVLKVIVQVANAAVDMLVPDRSEDLFRQVYRRDTEVLWWAVGG